MSILNSMTESEMDRPYEGPARVLPPVKLSSGIIARQLAWLRKKPVATWTAREREWYERHSGIAAVTVTTAWGAEFDRPTEAAPVVKPVTVLVTLATVTESARFAITGEKATITTTSLHSRSIGRRTVTLAEARTEYVRLLGLGYARW